ncbi:hypothetical protein EVAR_52909_1 [Eumeta japonica]|uniref:Uncharacterized protein n=1 Tax=Eumeta variegata TaxID=151549 RepID=A0A4C1Y616_EUMVA|nr:hypothetical protein EVAR_52909_1 [Eumeta japonica]
MNPQAPRLYGLPKVHKEAGQGGGEGSELAYSRSHIRRRPPPARPAAASHSIREIYFSAISPVNVVALSCGERGKELSFVQYCACSAVCALKILSGHDLRFCYSSAWDFDSVTDQTICLHVSGGYLSHRPPNFVTASGTTVVSGPRPSRRQRERFDIRDTSI